MSMPSKKYENTGIIRFVLALFVIFSHFYSYNKQLKIIPINLGEVAVSIFFIISGYYVELSLSRHLNFYSFLKSRLLRIVPQFYFAILILFFAILYFKKFFDFNIISESLMVYPGVHLFFSKNSTEYFSLVWALRLEILSYVIIGSIYFLFKLRCFKNLNYRFFTISFFYQISIFSIFFLGNSKLSYMMLFGIGILLTTNMHKIKYFFILISLLIHGTFILDTKSDIMTIYNLLLLFGSFLAFICCKLYFDNTKFNKIDNFLGVFSYDIYIYQIPVFYIFSSMMNVGYLDIFYLLALILLFSIPLNLLQKRYEKFYNFKFSIKSN